MSKPSKPARKHQYKKSGEEHNSVKTPRTIPRPENHYRTEPDEQASKGERGGINPSPLAIYLRQNKVSLGAFSRAIGMPHKTISQYAYGGTCPLLAAAAEIERLTKGAVPIEAWLGLPVCKTHILRWRANQPEESASLRSQLDAGGFARGRGPIAPEAALANDASELLESLADGTPEKEF